MKKTNEEKLTEINKRLECSVAKAEEELEAHKKLHPNKYNTLSDLPTSDTPIEDNKDDLMALINEDTIKFSKLSQLGVTKEERDNFISTQKERISKLSKMKLSLSDKLLLKGGIRVLSRLSQLPFQKR